MHKGRQGRTRWEIRRNGTPARGKNRPRADSAAIFVRVRFGEADAAAFRFGGNKAVDARALFFKGVAAEAGNFQA